MGGIDRIITNEITEKDVHTFRLDIDYSGRPEIIYMIDSPDAKDIKIYTERGSVKFKQEVMGSRTVLKFANPTRYYVLAYSKPNFVQFDQGIYHYVDTWADTGENLIVYGLPPYSVIDSCNYDWSKSKTSSNHLILDGRITGRFTTELMYRIDSAKFSEEDLLMVNDYIIDQIGFLTPPNLRDVLARSAELLDWLQRFQALAGLLSYFT